MATVIENGEKLLATAQELAETKFEIVKLKFIGKVSGAVSSIIAMIMVIVFATGALIVVSFGLSYLIGASLGNISYGFFIVGAVYALAGLLIYVNRSKWIERPLKDLFIDKITGNDD
jgi:hypothetical protein